MKVVADAAELAHLSPRLAILAMPPEGRCEAVTALPTLRAIMLEKPLGAPALRGPLAAACRARNIAVQVNFWWRGDPMMRALAGGKHGIGPPQAAFALYGNGLRNIGSHIVDLVRMLLGNCAAVRATSPFVTQAKLPLRGDGALSFVLELESGAQVSVQPLDFRLFRESALNIWGERGRLAIEQEGLLIRRFPRRDHRGLEHAAEIANDAPEALPVRAGEAMPALYDNLARALDGTEPLFSPLSSAIETERVLDALIDSAGAGGKRIALGAAE
ncbi:MAG TPA: hypothetical protein VIF14_02495 [Alphaproteobacteria bacterium]